MLCLEFKSYLKREMPTRTVRNLLCKFSATFSLIGLDGHGLMTTVLQNVHKFKIDQKFA